MIKIPTNCLSMASPLMQRMMAIKVTMLVELMMGMMTMQVLMIVELITGKMTMMVMIFDEQDVAVARIQQK